MYPDTNKSWKRLLGLALELGDSRLDKKECHCCLLTPQRVPLGTLGAACSRQRRESHFAEEDGEEEGLGLVAVSGRRAHENDASPVAPVH
jgi:hypothetical protein